MDYTITEDGDGIRTATSNNDWASIQLVAVRPDGPSRIFHRRAVRHHPDGTTSQVSWLVAELNGVRAYLDGGVLVLSTQDINP